MRCETLSRLEEGRLVSPSAERNKGPVAEALRQALPDRGLVLEIGSGTGQHIVHFAREAPHLTWQPSERDAECLRSIALWLAAEGPANVLAPLRLDVSEQPWPIAPAARGGRLAQHDPHRALGRRHGAHSRSSRGSRARGHAFHLRALPPRSQAHIAEQRGL
jgi:hypothetical protein